LKGVAVGAGCSSAIDFAETWDSSLLFGVPSMRLILWRSITLTQKPSKLDLGCLKIVGTPHPKFDVESPFALISL